MHLAMPSLPALPQAGIYNEKIGDTESE